MQAGTLHAIYSIIHLLSTDTRSPQVFYCSHECQVRGWKGGHRLECADEKHPPQQLRSQVSLHVSVNALAAQSGDMFNLFVASGMPVD